LQRLFSSFADGWPGIGLLLQRFLAAGLLLHFALAGITGGSINPSLIPSIVAACAGLLLLIGLWTPIAGTLIAIVELYIAITNPDQLWIPAVLATLGATVAMIGPGAWSIDARLFGRRHIHT